MKDWGQVVGDGRAAVGAGRTAGTRGWTVSSMGKDRELHGERRAGSTHLGPSRRSLEWPPSGLYVQCIADTAYIHPRKHMSPGPPSLEMPGVSL